VTDLVGTRRALHGVAEHLLAGPQYRASGTIRLRVLDGGFGTVAAPDVQVRDGAVLTGDRRATIDGATIEALAGELGLDAGPPEGVYHDGSGVGPVEALVVDPVSYARLAEAYAVAAAALHAFAPDVEPVLWPEHFDLGSRVAEVNYGVSPGDGYLGEPYAYVGVDVAAVPADPFWNAPFGAVRPVAELTGADELGAFFAEGRSRATR
jgi:hypothetical protein